MHAVTRTTGPGPTAADVQAAAERIRGQVIATPCLRSRTLSALTGAEIHVKFENFQYTASFKERGALNALLQLDARARRRGVVTVSAGNHGQAVACHARRLGIPATVVMPQHTPFVKVEHTRAHGAEVVLEGEALAQSFAYARRLVAARRLTLVHPFDDADVIAGQGTVALEMLDAFPSIDMLVVPVGGGGLVAGMAIAAKSRNPRLEIVGVQSESYPSMRAALHGRTIAGERNTIAEGIAVKTAGRLTRRIVRRLVDAIEVVGEPELERALTLYLNVEKTVAEGAGAAALAAVLADPDRYRGRRVGLVLSGGNIDPNLLASVIVRDLVRQQRIVSMRMTMPDRPGYLARISQVVADLGANVLQVDHRRLSVSLPARSATLELTFEARSAAHAAEVVAALRQTGLDPEILPP
ncbi:MAG: threonine ammonia-lyase [Gammaproteobacteria bacterium]|nr:threonine ammonia-lyase [Gammaproteobacteria bacterium]